MAKIDLMVEGGKASPTPQMAQTLGPMKINIGEVINKINEKTTSFNGIKVPVKLTIDEKTKEVDIEIGSPPAMELIKKEINLKKGSGKPNTSKVANIPIETVIKVAIAKKESLFTNSLKSAIKAVAGSCNSAGILIEGMTSQELNEKIDAGMFNDEITNEKTEAPPDKKAKLKAQLAEVKKELEKELEKLKAEEEEAPPVEEVVEGEAKEEGKEGEESEEGKAPAEGEKPAEETSKEEKSE